MMNQINSELLFQIAKQHLKSREQRPYTENLQNFLDICEKAYGDALEELAFECCGVASIGGALPDDIQI